MYRLISTAALVAALSLPAFAQDAPATDAEAAPATDMSASTPETAPPQDLRGPDAFADIADEGERSAAIFQEMGKVLTHPRCLNCHPKGDTPTQGDDMHVHMPPVIRGAADFGAPGMTCDTCHGPENYETVGTGGIESIPGHQPWNLAPVEMAWVGLSVGEICQQLKDPQRNGDRTLEELHEHNATDGLVGWGWKPGQGRTPAPGSQQIFGDLTRAWIDTGAACPG